MSGSGSNDDRGTGTGTGTEDGGARSSGRSAGGRADPALGKVIRGALRRIGLMRNGEPSVRDALDELIEGGNDAGEDLGQDERTLLGNILNIRDLTVEDVMVPRVDIVAIDVESSLADVVGLMTESGHSRLPVYRDQLDDALGMVHIKDILAWRGQDEQFRLAKLLRRVLFVAPSMQVLQLLLEMRATRSHMALVVDEFGGVDGLITIEDLVEEIVGEISDEHERDDEPHLRELVEGTLDADARVPVEELEERLGALLSAEERDEVDTVGGLVVSLAGRVPIRGELIAHPSGLEFEVLDADPRRIKRVRVRRHDHQARPAAAATPAAPQTAAAGAAPDSAPTTAHG